jgi:hypothetical protein
MRSVLLMVACRWYGTSSYLDRMSITGSELIGSRGNTLRESSGAARKWLRH